MGLDFDQLKQAENLEKAIEENNKKLEEERERLNKLAKESLQNGENLGKNEIVLKQTKIVDECILTELKLQKMLLELDPKTEE